MDKRNGLTIEKTSIMSVKVGRLTCLKFQVVPKRNFGTEQKLQTLNVILHCFCFCSCSIPWCVDSSVRSTIVP
jgi:hypothetical protein